MNTFAFRSSADAKDAYFVLLHTKEAPDATVWSEYVDADKGVRAMGAVLERQGGGPPARTIFVSRAVR